MKAVVVEAVGKYDVKEISLDGPKAGEVRVALKATGVCHSDLSVIGGLIPLPLPMVIGHEGAGVVEEVGEGVTTLAPGDHVVMSFVPTCGECFFCRRHQPFLCTMGPPHGMQLDGTSRHHLGDTDLFVMQFLGVMAEQAIVPVASCVKIDPDIPFQIAALIGCGVMTGVGAVINTAKVEPGSTVAVFGCGGVGLSIVQGARIAGAKTIIGVDLAENKLEMAKKFGATHAFSGEEAQEKIMELTDGIGVDYAFEAVGIPALMLAADAAARRGGTVTIVGVGKLTETVPLNALMLSMLGKTYKGSFYGGANPQVDFPNLLQLYRGGRLNLEEMVTRTYRIDDVHQAFEDMEAGINARGVISFE